MKNFQHKFCKKFLIYLTAFILLIQPAFAGTFWVDTNSDNAGGVGGIDCVEDETDNDDDCSLRDAINDVSANDFIKFLETMTITNAGIVLGTIDDNGVTVDGSTGGYTIQLDGNNGAFNGLSISADDVTVDGLYIYNYDLHGISIDSTADNTEIKDSVIGLNAVGTKDANYRGIYINDATDVLIDNNTISGNTLDGVYIYDGQDITLTGNNIGTDEAGTTAKANGGSGIFTAINSDHDWNGAQDVGLQIGTSTSGNTISGNTQNAIEISGSTSFTTTGDIKVQNNYIGLGSDGTTVLANGGYAFKIAAGLTTVNENIYIGSDLDSSNDDSEGNVISSNGSGGILLPAQPAIDNITVAKNKFGTDSAGTTAKASSGSAMQLAADTINIHDNVISNYANYGVYIYDASFDQETDTVTITDNLFGLDVNGENDFGNTDGDIKVDATNLTSLTIGGSGSDRNVLAYSPLPINIVDVKDTGSTVNIYNNYIGFESDGTTTATSDVDCIAIADGATINIGGNGLGNVIGNCTDDGIDITGGGSTSITIQDTYIGWGSDGTTSGSIGDHGIDIVSSSAATITIGGDRTTLGNVIGNVGGSGINFSAGGSSGITIQGTYIGLGSDGSTSGTVIAHGIHLQSNDATSITIGGSSSTLGNVIGNTSGSGIYITAGGSGGITVQGNNVGVGSDDTTPASITYNGLYIESSDAASSVLIGGATAALRNIFAACSESAIDITALSSSSIPVTIQGNYIGISSDGTTTTGLSNSGEGVSLQYGAITLGGDNDICTARDATDDEICTDGTGTLGEGNVISNNAGGGVTLSGSNIASLVAKGNIFGLKKDGTGEYNTLAANGGSGLKVNSSSITSIDLGATSSDPTDYRNIFSGSTSNYGVEIGDTTNLTTLDIVGNYFGTDYLGTSAVANTMGLYLIAVGANVTIGGTTAAERNIFSGNSSKGLKLKTGVMSIIGNYIGLGADGSTVIANGEHGIDIDSTAETIAIGNGTAAGRNIISGNAGSGINIGGGTDVKIQGNYIGTDKAGTSAKGNGSDNIAGLLNYGGILVNSANENAIVIGSDGDGTNDANEGNIISGNYGQGIALIVGNGVKIAGNIIGLSSSGAALGNQAGEGSSYAFLSTDATYNPTKIEGSGILIFDAVGGRVDHTKIGHDTYADLGNVISENAGSGIVILVTVDGWSGEGQNWEYGYIKNNKIGVAANGTTQMPNDGYNIYVNEVVDGALTNFSIGGSWNYINNFADVAIFMVEVIDINLATGSKWADLYGNNIYLDISTPPEHLHVIQYLDEVINDWLPRYQCQDGIDNDSDGYIDMADPGCDRYFDDDESSDTRGGGLGSVSRSTTKKSGEQVDREEEDEEDQEITEDDEEAQEITEDDEEAQEITEDTSEQEGFEPKKSITSERGITEYITTIIIEQKALPAEEKNVIYDYLKNKQEGQPEAPIEQTAAAAAIENIFDVIDGYEEEVQDTKDLFREKIDASIEKRVEQTIEKIFVKTAGFTTEILDNYEIVFSIDGATETSITPSTTNSYGVGIMFAIIHGLDPFEEDTNGDEIPDSLELFVHRNPANEGTNLAKEIQEGKILTNLQSFNGYPVVFSNNQPGNAILIKVVGEDGLYEAVIAKVMEKETEEIDEGEIRENTEIIEIERGEGEIEDNKDIYTVKNYLSDGTYYLIVKRIPEEDEEIEQRDDLPMFIAQFEVSENKLLEVSELEIITKTRKIDGEDMEVLVLKGKADPGVTIFASYRSAIYSSVVLSDANGEFEIEIPMELEEGEHEVQVYAYEEDLALQKGILSNISTLLFDK